MLLRSCWALLFLCAAVGFFGWLGLSDPLEELGNPAEEELQEQPSGWLRPRLEILSPDGHLRVAQLMEDMVHLLEDMAQLMEDMVQRMRSVSSWEAAGLKEEHRVVLSDLHHMQEKARDIYSQLESDLALLLTQQHQLEEEVEKLQWANQSLGLMLVAMENHLQNIHCNGEPDNGWSPSLNFTFILHGSCFVLLVALLVSTPPCAIMFLLLFLASSALGIPTLSTLLVLAVAGWWLVVARRGAGGPGLVLPQEEPCYQLTSTPDREHEMELLQEELDRMEMSSLQDPLEGVSPIPSGWRTKLSSCGLLEPVLGTGELWEPKPYNLSPSLASDMSSLSPKSPCQGLTRAGQRCRKKATPGQDFCHLHTTGGFTMDLSPRF